MQDALIRHWRAWPLRLSDIVVQWFWYLFGIDPDRIGYGHGLLNRLRSSQSQPERHIHITLLGASGDTPRFADVTAWAINRSSALCSASINGDLSEADIIWVYDQDPLSDKDQQKLMVKINSEAKPGAAVINAPDHYNAYHHPLAFPRLQAAGINVPRFQFSTEDKGNTLVVYKALGQQGKLKFLAYYDGERPGFKAFEYIHCRGKDGLYRRYRAHYLAGTVRGSEVLMAHSWNVRNRSSVDIDYNFCPNSAEIAQIKTIAEVLSLDYFAVDFLRRADSEQPVFTDINVFPTVVSPRSRVHMRGDWGLWHTFDARSRLGIAEPGGFSVWQQFDAAMASLLESSRK